jgi:hypothetical protein
VLHQRNIEQEAVRIACLRRAMTHQRGGIRALALEERVDSRFKIIQLDHHSTIQSLCIFFAYSFGQHLVFTRICVSINLHLYEGQRKPDCLLELTYFIMACSRCYFSHYSYSLSRAHPTKVFPKFTLSLPKITTL